MTDNTHVLNWIKEMKNLLAPNKVVWIDGTKKQQDKLIQEALSDGELIKLNQDKLPGCYLHRSHPADVARVENQTFVCSKDRRLVGNINNWVEIDRCKTVLRNMYSGIMSNRTMYVIPFIMGHNGSAFAKVGIELTDSRYVALNMNIMTRAGKNALEQLGDSNNFTRGLHSLGTMDENNRYICHFPEENTIASINSGYGGNALLGKKCFALRIASAMGKNEGWMAEHMLILGIENPQGEIKYITAAFPSACGKTNLAMMIPPEGLLADGYKVWCVGDDIAWLRIGEDGRLWAVNPENGFFGVAPGTGDKTNPNAMKCTHTDTIFTNVALNTEDDTVWWEGMTKEVPTTLVNWQGADHNLDTTKKAAHPNSRFTAPLLNCPCLSHEYNNPNGVPISAIIFGGRRAKTAPLVYESLNWEHGVFVGSSMASETTAAAAGNIGVVRRDPMAMLPFCGYDMGDYFSHWLEMGEKLGDKAPKIFNVNWFRTNEDGKFIWPGFGDNLRVLLWILDRCDGKAEGVEMPIGYLPKTEDINISGLNICENDLKELLSVDKELWQEEIQGVREFYTKIGSTVPPTLTNQLDMLAERLK